MPGPRSVTESSIVPSRSRDADLDREVGRRVLHRVREKVGKDLLDPNLVAARGVVDAVHAEVRSSRFSSRSGSRPPTSPRRARTSTTASRRSDSPAFDLRYLEDVGDEPLEALGMSQDRLDSLFALLGGQVVAELQQRDRPALDRREWRSKLVRYGRDEVVLKSLELASLGGVARDDDEDGGAPVRIRDPRVGAGQPAGLPGFRRDLDVGGECRVVFGPPLEPDRNAVGVSRHEGAEEPRPDHLFCSVAGDPLEGEVPGLHRSARGDREDPVGRASDDVGQLLAFLEDGVRAGWPWPSRARLRLASAWRTASSPRSKPSRP